MAFEYMQRYLLATGRQTILYKTDTLAYKAVNNLTENDVLFLSSSTGSNPSTLKLAKIAKIVIQSLWQLLHLLIIRYLKLQI